MMPKMSIGKAIKLEVVDVYKKRNSKERGKKIY